MAGETDLSRTEPASAGRLRDARAAGDVPRSPELSAWLGLLAVLGVLNWLGTHALESLQTLLAISLKQAAQPLAPAGIEAVQTVIWAVLPVFSVILVAALLAPLLLSGWVFAPGFARIDLKRIDPSKPLRRLLSADAWFDGGLALLKLILAGMVVAWVLAEDWQSIQASPLALTTAAAWVGRGVLTLVAVLTLIVALDAGWRWWRYLRRHAMTWQEVLAEARESEASPEMRAQVRSRQQRAGQNVNEVIG